MLYIRGSDCWLELIVWQSHSLSQHGPVQATPTLSRLHYWCSCRNPCLSISRLPFFPPALIVFCLHFFFIPPYLIASPNCCPLPQNCCSAAPSLVRPCRRCHRAAPLFTPLVRKHPICPVYVTFSLFSLCSFSRRLDSVRREWRDTRWREPLRFFNLC